MTTAAADSIRNLLGSSSSRRRLTCSRCKEFSTTNQATYSAHLRECSVATNASSIATTASSLAPALLAATVAAGGNSMWPPSNDQNPMSIFNPNDPTSWLTDPLSLQLVLQQLQQKQNQQQEQQQQQQHDILALATTALNQAEQASQNSKSSAATTVKTPKMTKPDGQPVPLSEEHASGSGERYGFREVFKHMYQATVNGAPAYCCRLCPYQHAVRSRVTKHIRLQHFSKQALSIYTCELCSFTTQHATELEHHQRRHAVNTKVYKCTECEYSTPMQNNFKRHLRRHTSSDAFVCSFCSFSSPHEATVKRHAFLYHRKSSNNQNNNDEPSQNPPSNNATNSNDNEDDYIEMDEDGSNLSGKVGKLSRMDTDDKASDSGASCNGSNHGVFVCDVCSHGFANLVSFSEHRASHDNANDSGHMEAVLDLTCNNPSVTPDTLTSNGTNDQRVKQEASNDILNLSTKVDDVPQQLRGIKRQLNSSSEIDLPSKQMKSEQVDSSEMVKVYGCPICQFTSSDKSLVRQHLAAEHPKATFMSSSRKSTSRNSNATAAMLPIRCLTAPKSEIESSSHFMKPATPLSTSSTPTPDANNFSCNLCIYRTNVKSNYEKHIAYHEDLKIFLCSTCGYRCNWKWDMNKHCRTVHTDQPQPSGESSTYTTLSLSAARSTIADYLRRCAQSSNRPISLTIYRCSDCSFSSRRRKIVARHQRQKHSNSTIIETTPNNIENSSEITVNTGGIPTPPTSLGTPSSSSSPTPTSRVFKCSICGLRSMWKKSIKSHLATQHPSSNGTVLILYVPQQNDNSSSSASPSLRAKSNCRAFKCPICVYRANFYHDVKKHVRNLHHSEEEVVILEREFAEKTLNEYLMNHSRRSSSRVSLTADSSSQMEPQQKPIQFGHYPAYCPKSRVLFNCRKCTFHTRRRSSFIEHCKRHFRNSRAGSCEQCGYSTQTLNQLQLHKTLWHQQRRKRIGFKCKVCNEEMPKARVSDVKEHVINLHCPDHLLALGAVRFECLYSHLP